MIKVGIGQTVEERLGKIEQSINRSPVLLPFPCADVEATVAAGTTVNFGGCTVDRSWSRKVLPDAQWVVRAAGFANSVDANALTVALVYWKDTIAAVTIGSTTTTLGAYTKLALGPFDVFATAGVPTSETIASVRLQASKGAGAAAKLGAWTIWLELRASRT